ncbi:hypothetical protein DPMN_173953 [Dreissena polymorpha]|uniref:Uncharacterized protein n=1 Tax=Dreissena polymorpha TaxID=45954 RepID=A0A9D4IHF0_DREPO|nr:hypothetical protein DPMN_173953 [Dreissena polymorpha]
MSKSRVPYKDGLDSVARKRYEEKLSLINGLDPYEEKEGWSDESGSVRPNFCSP